jgi:hypothetical protein
MEIRVTKQSITPNQEVIEILDGLDLIATIIPKDREIAVVSKYIIGVDKDMEYPPKITVQLRR